MAHLGVQVEGIQILSFLVSLVAIVAFDLALVRVLLCVELPDVKRGLEDVEVVGEPSNPISTFLSKRSWTFNRFNFQWFHLLN